MTERTPLADDDVIALVRRVAPGESTLDVDALLVRSRRSVARRRAASLGAVTTGVAAAAVAVGLVVGPGLGRTGSLPATPGGRSTTSALTSAPTSVPTSSPDPTASGTAVAQPYRPPGTVVGPATPPTSVPGGTAGSAAPTTPAGGSGTSAAAASLLAVFGTDWVADNASAGGFAGDIRAEPGSRATSGLPSGYAATVRLMSFTGTGGFPVDSACRGLTEKGTVFGACSPVTAPDGTTVQRQDIDGARSGQWAWSSTRLITQRPDGSVQVADLIASHEGGVPTGPDRERAVRWLTGELTHLETAVVTIDLPASSK